MSAGDFVRWCKQVLDLLDQLAAAPADQRSLVTVARAASSAIRRGVVAQSMQV